MTLKGTETAGGGINPRSIRSQAIIARTIHKDVLKRRYVLENFEEQPVKMLGDGYGAAVGTDAAQCMARFRSGLIAHWLNIGTQTIVGPVLAATGLDVVADKTNNEGIAYYFGTDPTFGAVNPFRNVGRAGVGTFARLKFKIADVSGTDDCAFGWVKSQAHQAAIDDLTDFIAINVISGNVKRESALNDGETVTVDSALNWADGEEHAVEIQLLGDGYARILYDGVDITTLCGARYRVDASDVMIPFFYYLHDAVAPGACFWTEFEAGTLYQVGRDGTRR
jgi:phosphohistidine swiveling domain-containing protein